MTNFQFLKEVLEIVSYITVIFSVPWAIFVYIKAKKKEEEDREYGTYNALDEKYLEYMEKCIEYPNLDVFHIADANPKQLNEIEKKQELILFAMQFSIIERAFLMYSGQKSEIRKRQWKGWEESIDINFRRSNYQNSWKILGEGFDSDFQEYINGVIASYNVVV